MEKFLDTNYPQQTQEEMEWNSSIIQKLNVQLNSLPIQNIKN